MGWDGMELLWWWSTKPGADVLEEWMQVEFLNDVAPFEMLAALSRTGNPQQPLTSDRKKKSRAPSKSVARLIDCLVDLGTLWVIRKQSDTRGAEGAQSGIGSGIGAWNGNRHSTLQVEGGWGVRKSGRNSDGGNTE